MIPHHDMVTGIRNKDQDTSSAVFYILSIPYQIFRPARARQIYESHSGKPYRATELRQVHRMGCNLLTNQVLYINMQIRSHTS